MDKQLITVEIKEYRNGEVTVKTVTYIRWIESMDRFYRVHEMRNRIVERLSK